MLYLNHFLTALGPSLAPLDPR